MKRHERGQQQCCLLLATSQGAEKPSGFWWRRTAVPLAFAALAGCAAHSPREKVYDATYFKSTSTFEVAAFRTEVPNFDSGGYAHVANRYLLPIYAEKPVDWYCGCDFDGKTKAIDEDACGYVGNRNDRSKRIEWEHVVPRSWMADKAGCSSVATCTDLKFKRAITDPYNLIPAHGSLNGKRSNHSYWEVAGELREFGVCDFEVAKETVNGQTATFIEPPNARKGDLARIVLYYIDRYELGGLPDDFVAWMHIWAQRDPISIDERVVLEAIRDNVADWEASPLDY